MSAEQEAEANLFAMHLLMPEDMVRREMRRMKSFDMADDKAIARLAKTFQVPQSIMAMRLGMLMEPPPRARRDALK